ncbi:MAG: hypothetical protein EHJ95_02540 [Methanobacteriota archaeon]|nr:MAG: hypothetical protein EHJ95_02540 [Euryarchaeota archaeon]
MKESMLWITALLLAVLAVSVAEGAVDGAGAALTCDYRTVSRSDQEERSFGDLIEISGINRVSPYTYLSLRGPGIPDEGTPLTNPTEPGGANIAVVRSDGTWNFTWDSAELYSQGRYWFSPGTYQIVASADATHQVICNVSFERSYLVGRLNRSVVVEGEDVVLTGWADALQDPQHLYVWIFGPIYASYSRVVTLDQDGFYQLVLPTQRVAHFSTGDYQVLVQHPMGDRQQDATVKSGTVVHLPGDEGLPEGQDVDLAQMDPEDAVRMLKTSLRSEYCDRDDPCDDAYISLQFSIVPMDSPRLRGEDALAFVAPLATTTAATTTATTVAPTTNPTEIPSPTTAAAPPTTALPTATLPESQASPVGAASVLAVPLLILAFRRIIRRP